MRRASPANAAFAATMVGFGLVGLSTGGFAGVWVGVPKSLPAREALAWLSAVVSLLTGLGLFWRRGAAPAASVLSCYLLFWMLAFKAPAIVAAPLSAAVWESCGETAAVAGAAGVLFVNGASPSALARLVNREAAARAFRSLFGCALLAFGFAHLAYLRQTASLVPGWLPAHDTWVILTGIIYIAAGVAIIADKGARLAAALAALQIGLFTAVIWLPAVATGKADAPSWSETLISWWLTTAAWVVASSYPPTRSVWFEF